MPAVMIHHVDLAVGDGSLARLSSTTRYSVRSGLAPTSVRSPTERETKTSTGPTGAPRMSSTFAGATSSSHSDRPTAANTATTRSASSTFLLRRRPRGRRCRLQALPRHRCTDPLPARGGSGHAGLLRDVRLRSRRDARRGRLQPGGNGLAEQPLEDGLPPPATVLRPGSVQRVDAVDVEVDEDVGTLSTW